MNYQILQGDNRLTLKTIPDNSVDAIVTDPPYGIDFLGKAWDVNTGALETYQECLRVLKPGGHILAFSAARTYHHLAVTLEQAGFEIRDQIMWIYSSGFPKSQDIGRSIQRSLGVKEKKAHKHNVPRNGGAGDTKHYESDGQTVCTDPEAIQWQGWGTQLKPAHEPIALARKPIKLSIAKNCQQWGVGALNIDATRVAGDDLQKIADWYSKDPTRAGTTGTFNNILSEAQDKPRQDRVDAISDSTRAQEDILKGRFPSNVLGDIPDYQKYFYCPKVGRKERHIGMADVKSAPQTAKKGNGIQRVCETCGTPQMQAKDCLCAVKSWVMPAVNGGNNHPTVKPIELMKYLIQLITPPGGTVLDPFSGSGSTGCAAVELGHPYIGCELDPAYVDIAKRRIEAWSAACNPTTFHRLFSPGSAHAAK